MDKVFVSTPEQLTEQCFARIANWLYGQTGISLTAQKKLLVSGRLMPRLRALQLASYDEYFQRILQNSAEAQTAVNLLTTNETYFFREEAHFALLEELITSKVLPASLVVWSAACASGEEPYSIALLLASLLGSDAGWKVDASDVNTDVLDLARQGIYPLSRAARIPAPLLKRYCLKGIGKDDGYFRIEAQLRQRVNFFYWNLLQARESKAAYDVIYLRNVLIYFDDKAKVKVINHLRRQLKPGGFLMVGHAESLQGRVAGMEALRPGCYRFI
ncbi:CheR family methyltransferase [Alishewanella longhuensis]